MKKDLFNILIFIIIIFLVFLISTKNEYFYISSLDYINQHLSLADYFRDLIYNSKKLIPSFSLHLGSGQSIFNFAYYGFFSPILFLSLFFPFISMKTFLVISLILNSIITIILLYIYLRNNNYNENISFITTMIFLLSSPIIFHNHRQIMFVNYLPFIIISFMLIDKYFETNKKYLLSLTVFLIIISSYYFSVSSLVVLALYVTFKFLKINKFNFKKYFLTVKDLIKPIILGILLSSVFLLPIIDIILDGRMGIKENYTLIDFLPQINLKLYFYSTYSLGLTSLFLHTLSNGIISKKREYVFLSIVFCLIMFCPIIIYILNGCLYINSKVLIPFIPLASVLYAFFLDNFSKNKINYRKLLKVLLIVFTFIIILSFSNFNKIFYIFIIDFILTTLLLFISKKYNKKIFIVVFLIILLSFNIIVNLNEKYINKKDYNIIHDKIKNKLIDKTIESDKDFYRFSNLTDQYYLVNKIYNKYYFTTSLYSSTYNNYYNNFYFEEFDNENSYRNTGLQQNSKNVLYDILLGVKYNLTNYKNTGLLKLKSSEGKYKIYKNDYVYPIGYVTRNNINIKDYEKLKYPYNLEALLISSISNDKTNFDYESNIKNLNWTFDDFNIYNTYGVVRFDNKTEKTYNFKLPEELKEKALIISFKMNETNECNKGDTYIKINGIKNKLTCKTWKYRNNNKTFNYVISNKSEIDLLKVTISKGKFNISDLKFYIIDFDYLKSLNKKIDKLEVKRKDIKENGFVGFINVSEKGKFVLSIPYSDKFVIKVDGKKVNYEKINKAFIGFELEKGKHKVEIKFINYHMYIGLVISSISLLLLIILIIKEKKTMI